MFGVWSSDWLPNPLSHETSAFEFESESPPKINQDHQAAEEHHEESQIRQFLAIFQEICLRRSFLMALSKPHAHPLVSLRAVVSYHITSPSILIIAKETR